MRKEVDGYIAERREEMVEALRGLLRIPSVRGEAAPNAPMGTHVREALDYTLELARKLGFECTDMDGYIGCVDYGEGEELLGIMCHLDVVPEGIGWDYPPYEAALADGKIYARGTVDDKGPTVSALYALAAIKAAGLPMRRRVRVMLGCDEETSWECMKHYAKSGETPHLAFSPDADYPVVNSEKGIVHGSFKRQFNSEVTVVSGSRPNVVPNDSKLTVPAYAVSLDDLMEASAPVIEAGFEVDYDMQGDTILITVDGLGAHAASPEMGKNALLAGITLLSRLPLEGEDAQVAACLANAFGLEVHGETLGLDVTDESGRTTFNAGVMRWDENGISEFSVDIRCPRTLELEKALKAVENALAPKGIKLYDSELKAGHFVPRESELVSKLLDVYAKRMGEAAEPLAIGGGTYARAIENAVAFGCKFPDAPDITHMPNEHVSVDEFMLNALLIADAIIALAVEQ